MEQTALGSWAGARILVLSPTPTHPQDYGNRKRIFQVCKRFADEGARITFVHYPAEAEWRETLPWRAEREMSAAWAQYYPIGPTRGLHTSPNGRHHTIDAWWDEAIGNFLRWLFSVQSFDIFVVNYSWLSKAFECAPKSVFKILDTHDRMSGRREMLESLGLDPEFFYTTEDDERIALSRADLVWAIKKEEAALFAHLAATPVLTLPHLDPFRPMERPAPDLDGYLRVGIIGARNNINRINITGFVEAAEPVFRNAFAPLKLVIAGSVCEMLGDLGGPFVELRGPVESVADFYRTIDCVAVPMRVSSGLKIKTGEALSLGLPVISLAHAFEGYEPSDRLHGLAEFSDMAEALVDLAFAPRDRLDALAEASQRSHTKTSAVIAETFRRTGDLVQAGRRLIVIAVDSRAFVTDSIFNLALISAHDYLRRLANIVILVVRGSAAHVADNMAAVDRFRRVVVGRDLHDAEPLQGTLAALGVDLFDVEAFLRHMRPKVLMVDALHPAMFRDCCADSVAISRSEMIAFSEGGGAFEVPGAGYRRAFVAAPAMSREAAAAVAASGAEFLFEPIFWRSASIRFPRVKARGDTKTVALLGTPEAPAVAMAAAIVKAWRLKPHVVCGISEVARSLPEDASIPCARADAYIAAITSAQMPPPHFAIDLSAGGLGLSLCREFLERLRIPVVSTAAVGLHGSLGMRTLPLRATTEGELWQAVRAFAMDPDAAHDHAFDAVWRDLEGDHGWAWLWRYCSRLFETDDAEFA